MTITSNQCLIKFGAPEWHNNMEMLMIPDLLSLGVMPRRLYCNKIIHKPLLLVLSDIVSTGNYDKIETFDGCYCIRKMRNDEKRWSLHSWGIALDFNANTNIMGRAGSMSPDIVKSFEKYGFEWGGRWKNRDDMHFQIASLGPSIYGNF